MGKHGLVCRMHRGVCACHRHLLFSPSPRTYLVPLPVRFSRQRLTHTYIKGVARIAHHIILAGRGSTKPLRPPSLQVRLSRLHHGKRVAMIQERPHRLLVDAWARATRMYDSMRASDPIHCKLHVELQIMNISTAVRLICIQRISYLINSLVQILISRRSHFATFAVAGFLCC